MKRGENRKRNWHLSSTIFFFHLNIRWDVRIFVPYLWLSFPSFKIEWKKSTHTYTLRWMMLFEWSCDALWYSDFFTIFIAFLSSALEKGRFTFERKEKSFDSIGELIFCRTWRVIRRWKWSIPSTISFRVDPSAPNSNIKSVRTSLNFFLSISVLGNFRYSFSVRWGAGKRQKYLRSQNFCVMFKVGRIKWMTRQKSVIRISWVLFHLFDASIDFFISPGRFPHLCVNLTYITSSLAVK